MPSESHSRFEPKLKGGAHPRSATMLHCVGVRCRNLRERHRAKSSSGRVQESERYVARLPAESRKCFGYRVRGRFVDDA
jgi:hypothetical protein